MDNVVPQADALVNGVLVPVTATDLDTLRVGALFEAVPLADVRNFATSAAAVSGGGGGVTHPIVMLVGRVRRVPDQTSLFFLLSRAQQRWMRARRSFMYAFGAKFGALYDDLTVVPGRGDGEHRTRLPATGRFDLPFTVSVTHLLELGLLPWGVGDDDVRAGETGPGSPSLPPA